MLLSYKFNYAQDTSSVKSRFGIGFSVDPGFSYRTVHVDSISTSNTYYKKYRDFLENGKTGCALNLFLFFELNRNFRIQSGFQISEKGYNRKNQLWHDENGMFDEGYANVYYQMRFIGFALEGVYVMNLKNFRLRFTAGGSFDYLFQNRLKAKIEYTPPSNTQPIMEFYEREAEPFWFNYPVWSLDSNKFNPSVNGSVAIEVDINEKASLFIGPKFNYAFTTIFEYPFRERLYQIGGTVGFSIKL